MLTDGTDPSKDNAIGDNLMEKRAKNSGDVMSQQPAKEKSSLESTVGSPPTEGVSIGYEQLREEGDGVDTDEMFTNRDVRSPKSKKKEDVTGKAEGKGSAFPKMSLFSCGPRGQNENIQKVRIFVSIAILP